MAVRGKGWLLPGRHGCSAVVVERGNDCSVKEDHSVFSFYILWSSTDGWDTQTAHSTDDLAILNSVGRVVVMDHHKSLI